MNIRTKRVGAEDKIPYYSPPNIVYIGEQRDIIGENVESIKKHHKASMQKKLSLTTKEVNKLCLESSVYTPSLKSLAYFSELQGFENRSDKARKLMVNKNPIAFGVGVYLETAAMIYETNSDFTYRTPSQQVGLEFAKHPIIERGNIAFDTTTKSVIAYANKAEEMFEDLEYVLKSLASITKPLAREALQRPSVELRTAISVVLDIYHKGMAEYVEKGVAYTIIEDVWLVSKSQSAREFAQNMLIMYDFAEATGAELNYGYPVFDSKKAESFMQEMMSEFDNEQEYTLYSAVFDNIIRDEVTSSRNRTHYIGHLIPQYVYSRLILTPMMNIKNKLIKYSELNKYR